MEETKFSFIVGIVVLIYNNVIYFLEKFCVNILYIHYFLLKKAIHYVKCRTNLELLSDIDKLATIFLYSKMFMTTYIPTPSLLVSGNY